MKTWLITGASTGIGRGIAEAVLKKGDQAAITARDIHKIEDLKEKYGDRALCISLEVTNKEQRNTVRKKTSALFLRRISSDRSE